MNKHTPGPWKYYKRSCPDPDELHRFFIGQPGGNNHIIANTVKEYASIDDEANARLIAEAPELLAACASVMKAINGLVNSNPSLYIDPKFSELMDAWNKTSRAHHNATDPARVK